MDVTLTWGQDYSTNNWHLIIEESGRMQRAACNSRFNVVAQSGTDQRSDWDRQYATCARCQVKADKITNA